MDDDLGPLEKSYEAATGRAIRYAVLSGLAAAGCLLFVLRVFGYLPGFEPYGRSQQTPAAGLGGFFGLSALGILGFTWWHWGRRVDVYRDGFIYSDRWKEVPFRWDEVAYIYSDLTTMNMHGLVSYKTDEVRIRKNDKTKIDLSASTQSLEELVLAVMDKTFPRMWQETVEKYENGDAVDFDAIRMSRLVFDYNPGTFKVYTQLPWSEIADIHFEGLQSRVTRRTDNKLIRFLKAESSINGKVANRHIAIKLIERIRAEGLIPPKK